MGKMNLLKAEYVGKVGATYGVTDHHKAILKAVPFSHSLHNDKQKNAKDAFTLLNRISATIAKNFWAFLGLSDRGMYRNNAVAKWLKVCLVENEFHLENLSEVINADGSLSLESATLEYQSGNFTAILKNTPDTENVDAEYIFIAVVNQKMKSLFATVTSGQNIYQSPTLDLIGSSYVQLIAFKEIPFYRKHKIKGLVLSDKIFLIIVNHVFYVMRWSWSDAPRVENHVLYLPKDKNIVLNGVLYLR